MAPCVVVWTGSSVVFRFRIVRGFCFVKCDVRGCVCVGRGGLDSRLRGNDVGGIGNDVDRES